jgi:hypothetical protein
VDVLKRQAFTVYVAANMALCAILFAPWALPRETISGLLGRWRASVGWKFAAGTIGAAIVDRLYFWDADHCAAVAAAEAQARAVLYPPAI